MGRANSCWLLQLMDKIPIKFFADQIVNHNYNIVFTGHSLGAATASLVAMNLLTFLKSEYNNVLFIGFGSPLIGCQDFKKFVENSDFSNNFHFFINENDIVPVILSRITKYAHLGFLVELDAFQSFFNLSSNMKNYNQINPEDRKSFLKSFITSILEKIVKMTPINYVQFGKLFRIKDSKTIEDASNENVDANIKDIDSLLTKCQMHFMNNYYIKLRQFIKNKVSDLKPNDKRAPMQEFRLEIPEKINWENVSNKKSTIEELNDEPCSYHTKVNINDSS
jgi:hypothetical protein